MIFFILFGAYICKNLEKVAMPPGKCYRFANYMINFSRIFIVGDNNDNIENLIKNIHNCININHYNNGKSIY